MAPKFPSLIFAVVFLAAPTFAAESQVSPASNAEATSRLERPTSGSGSVRLTNVSVRQESRTYKVLPQGELKLHFFFPPNWQPTDRRPAILFFHGYSSKDGGFAEQFFPQSEYLASRGLVCATADYRQPLPTGWEPAGTIEDAKSAMRWLRVHARELGVDPGKLIGAGGSWGGMQAANLALAPGFDTPGEDTSVSCIPNALVLFNPAVGPIGKLVEIDPLRFVKKNAPPALVFCGTEDRLRPANNEFVAKLRALDNRCDYFSAAGQGHGFFNNDPWATATLHEVDRFLVSLGYLAGEPTLKPAEVALTAVLSQ